MNDTLSKSITFTVPDYLWDAVNKKATKSGGR